MSRANSGHSSGTVRLARLLSAVFHPFLLSLATLAWVIYLDEGSWGQAWLWTGLGLAIVVLPLSLFIFFNKRHGRYTDWDISIREQRANIYKLAGVCFVLLLFIFVWAGAPTIALACLFAALLAVLLAAMINQKVSKISLHAVAVAGCTAVLFSMSVPAALLVALIGLAVSWARLHLQQHTVTQILLGWGVATTAVVIVFELYL